MKTVLRLLVLLGLLACDRQPEPDVELRELEEELIADVTISVQSFADIVAACQLDDVQVEIRLRGSVPVAEMRAMELAGLATAHEQQYQCWREILVGKLDAG